MLENIHYHQYLVFQMMKFAVVLFVCCTMLLMVESNVLREAGQPNRDVNDPYYHGSIDKKTDSQLFSQMCIYLCKIAHYSNCDEDCGYTGQVELWHDMLLTMNIWVWLLKHERNRMKNDFIQIFIWGMVMAVIVILFRNVFFVLVIYGTSTDLKSFLNISFLENISFVLVYDNLTIIGKNRDIVISRNVMCAVVPRYRRNN